MSQPPPFQPPGAPQPPVQPGTPPGWGSPGPPPGWPAAPPGWRPDASQPAQPPGHPPYTQPIPGYPPYAQPTPPPNAGPATPPTQTARDPRTPFGATPTSQLSIENYAPPRPKTPLVIAVILAVAALIVALFVITQSPAPKPAPSATPHATPSGDASWGMRFASADGRQSGQWQIVAHEWTNSSLRVQVRVAVDRGPIRVGFFAYPNDNPDVVYPDPSADFADDAGTLMKAGDDRTGWVQFPVWHTNVTLILADFSGWSAEPMSALPVPA